MIKGDNVCAALCMRVCLCMLGRERGDCLLVEVGDGYKQDKRTRIRDGVGPCVFVFIGAL